ncbi:hypothetical protein LNKW23_32500 [Paralimibaculum aggregatum]|uniref:Dynamin N-terminal domain-containing protein n=1 Tax=Paralimibaculum aggregatum TaxID=3036245 RepID=A0ABQ6LRR1_9RHOB|nr:dynamin family protein [Limibaculum sp. NKW23]GMG84036.1 hypothetical protein LNKW23_32500 [Limibaculum sp. NKW23]
MNMLRSVCPGAPPAAAADRARRIARWLESPPRCALMGEFSAGKSTLLNLLLGRDAVPTRVTATQLPALRFGHGETVRVLRRDHDGSRRIIAPSEIPACGHRSCAMLEITAPDAVLRDCTIFDTPGISDPMLAHDVLPRVAGASRFVLWCTNAAQAWRQTEKERWLSLPPRLRAESVLVVTRADMLSPADARKVRARLERETAGLFRDVVFIATPRATEALNMADEEKRQSAWAASGGEDLFAAFRTSIDRARAWRRELLKRRGPAGRDLGPAGDDLGPAGGNAAPGIATPGDPAPDDLAPGDLAPGNPAPGDLAPGDLAPGDLAPGDLAPGDLAAGNPAPGNPAPGGLAPGNPAPGDPAPGNPAPGDPAPGDLAPGDPAPGDPAPGDLAPGDLAPGDLEPNDRAPGDARNGSASAPPEPPAPAPPARPETPPLAAWDAICAETAGPPEIDRIRAAAARFADSLARRTDAEAPPIRLLRRLVDLRGEGDLDGLDPQRLARQLRREIATFSTSDWREPGAARADTETPTRRGAEGVAPGMDDGRQGVRDA